MLKTSLNYYKLQILNPHFFWQPNRPCWLQSKVHIQFIFYFIILLIKLFNSPISCVIQYSPVSCVIERCWLPWWSAGWTYRAAEWFHSSWSTPGKTLTEFRCDMRHSYSNVALLSLRVLVPFVSTYLCESGFSTLLQIKTKAINRKDVENDMRLALTQTKPRISKRVTQMQPQSSHKLLILLCCIFNVMFTFLSNIFSKYILFNGLFLLLRKKMGGRRYFCEI